MRSSASMIVALVNLISCPSSLQLFSQESQTESELFAVICGTTVGLEAYSSHESPWGKPSHVGAKATLSNICYHLDDVVREATLDMSIVQRHLLCLIRHW